jgi:hypothetical protein
MSVNLGYEIMSYRGEPDQTTSFLAEPNMRKERILHAICGREWDILFY